MKIIAIVHETPEILAGVFFKVFKGFKGDTLRLALILPPPIHIFNQKEKIKQGAFRSPKLKVFKTPFQKKKIIFFVFHFIVTLIGASLTMTKSMGYRRNKNGLH